MHSWFSRESWFFGSFFFFFLFLSLLMVLSSSSLGDLKTILSLGAGTLVNKQKHIWGPGLLILRV